MERKGERGKEDRNEGREGKLEGGKKRRKKDGWADRPMKGKERSDMKKSNTHPLKVPFKPWLCG